MTVLPAWRSVCVAVGLALGVCMPCFSQSSQRGHPSELAPKLVGTPPPPYLWPIRPVAESPVDRFRELLALSPAQRAKALAGRSPENRRLLLAKLREYDALKPSERELRLRVTELHYYLLPLMHTPATNRPAQLAMIPLADRQLVEDRLAEWDKLAPVAQSQLLTNEAAIRYFTEIQSGSDAERENTLKRLSPASRQKYEASVAQWKALPPRQRRQTLAQFEQFWRLTPQEKQRALNTLSEPERLQIQKTLVTFNGLPASMRSRCIRSFEKFAGLSLAERQQFLENAQRWRLMSPEQREAWRDLVNTLASESEPPLPYDVPPLPPGFNAANVTNGG